MKRAGGYARIAFGLILLFAGTEAAMRTDREWLWLLSTLLGGFWCGWGMRVLRRLAE